MAAGMLMKMACVAMACMVVFAPHAAEALTCGQVNSNLLPCLNYLRANGPLGGCCNGVRSLNSAAQTPADRKVACNCIKSAYSQFSGIDQKKASSLPSTCGVSVPYKISPNTDCSKIN
ncbi:hypothetical protein OSB04_023049 [Centaurea solstitialis]|uniref:Non-specific lipid-transfer protein n=1 Tax=Centaurea solstitialis TaxID=347529 RepID=A0AA38T1X6_9ASTR|nr:hypothetical protein OSB04_023049 [Centaurea solstitialis]